MKLPIKLIQLNPQQPRTVFGESEMQALADSIRENDLEQPIQVKENGDGTYTLVDGERRLRAHQLLDRKEIEVFVKGKMTEKNSRELLVSALAANLAHDGLNAVDEAAAYYKLRHVEKMSVREIALACGTYVVNVHNKMKINLFSEAERGWMKDGSLPVEGKAIDALLAIPNEKQRIKVAKRLAERRAATNVVVKVCEKFILAKKQIRAQKQIKKAGGINHTPATERTQEEPSEWYALYQVGKVPPWKNFTESVMKTCDACSLRPMASQETCGACPLVVMIENVLESVK